MNDETQDKLLRHIADVVIEYHPSKFAISKVAKRLWLHKERGVTFCAISVDGGEIEIIPTARGAGGYEYIPLSDPKCFEKMNRLLKKVSLFERNETRRNM